MSHGDAGSRASSVGARVGAGTRAAAAVIACVLALAALVGCSVDERPADQRPHVALTPVPDPTTSQLPPVPADPRSVDQGSQSG